MRQHREAHGLAARQLRGHAQRHQRVHAGIDLGMPALGLRHAEQSVDLGKDALQRVARPQRFDVDVGALRRERFDGFLPHALGAQRLHLAGRDDLAHELERFAARS